MLRRTLLLAGALVLALAGSAQADHIRKDFLSFNACGAIHMNDNPGCKAWGGKYNDPSGDTLVKAIKRSIDNGVVIDGERRFYTPHVVMLQELCHNQFDALRDQLPGWEEAFEPTGWNISSDNPENANCNGTDKRHGLAVFSQAAISTEIDVLKFANQAKRTDGTDEDRKMLCVKVNWANPARVCSTHLATHDKQCGTVLCSEKQTQEIKNYVRNNYLPYHTPVVIGGDFNAQEYEATLDHLYASWIDPGEQRGVGEGDFKEVDQGEPACRCGEGTLGESSKYDYIFLSQGKWDHVDGDATHSDWSDHDPLWGKAILGH